MLRAYTCLKFCNYKTVLIHHFLVGHYGEAGGGDRIIPILEMRTLKPREVIYLAVSETTGK